MQTRGLDITQAVGLVEKELKVLSADRSKFDDHLQKANAFCRDVQSLIDSHTNVDFDVTLETTLPQSTLPRKKRRMFDEMAADETPIDPLQNFRLNTYLVVIDRLCQEVSSRFNEKNSSLYKELSLLSPKNYVWLCGADVTSFSLENLAKLSDVDELDLKEEVKHFAKTHKDIVKRLTPSLDAGERSEQQQFGSDDDDEDIDDNECSNPINPKCNGKCTHCLGCILKMIVDYRFHCKSYNKLYQCLRTVLTLPCTVVSCERVFSKLKFVKNRLRASLGQELLEAMLVCSTETDLLRSISNDIIYEKLAEQSTEMKRLLMF